MTIFDRTWYGRVMVERIEGFCSQNEWRRAYREINQMEQNLTCLLYTSYQGMPKDIPVRESDFIFAVIAEELGGFFAICLILVFMSCFIMFINISLRLTNNFYKLLAIGLSIAYGFQLFLCIGGVIKFIPVSYTHLLRFAILAEDAKAISKAPGIGPKTAKRMIIELKDKLDLESMIDNHGDSSTYAAGNTEAAASVRDEVIMAVSYTHLVSCTDDSC